MIGKRFLKNTAERVSQMAMDLQDLSLHNYHVMRDFVADPKFLLQKKIEARLLINIQTNGCLCTA